MRAIMDGRKILLAKLSQGGIGEENAHLLGSLLVAKIAQAAMSRQDEEAAGRVPFFLYMDEFHHFITPSIATILSGARKYGLGLTLAHQEMRQLKSRSEEIASAVLGNVYTRVVFRVGEQDAKSLADGFSFFEWKDLQNLGTGEAIARIERPDFDFNLCTIHASTVPTSIARDHQAAVLQASRRKYATPKSEVETQLRSDRPEVVVAKHTQPYAASKQRKKKTETSSITVATPPASERLPGRGGSQHKYLQSLLSRLAEDRGFKTTTEKRVLEGHGHVDVYLERNEISIGCEVSITTNPEHEIGNLSKCLAAGFTYAVLVSPEESTLAEAQTLFGYAHGDRVRFLSPDGFISFLRELDRPAESDSKSQETHRVGAAAKSLHSMEEPKRMLSAEDAAAFLGLATQTLAKLRWSGDSPPYFKVGRRVLYERDELSVWLEHRKRRSTSDFGIQGS